MASTLKEFATLIAKFIDELLMPIIQAKASNSSRIPEQWKQLRSLIIDAETIQIRKIQNFMANNCYKNSNNHIRQINNDAFDKQSLNPPNKIYGSQFESQSWKYSKYTDKKQTEDKIEQQQADRKQRASNKLNSVGNSYDLQLSRQKNRDENIQSFDVLLSSFRKLCTNFENNHKKLVRDRQSSTL